MGEETLWKGFAVLDICVGRKMPEAKRKADKEAYWIWGSSILYENKAAGGEWTN